MVWWQAALWAVLGGFVVEALELSTTLRRHRKWPWQVDAEHPPDPGADTLAAGPVGYFVGEALRLAAGAGLGAALAGQITGSLPAVAVGAAAPVVAGHLTSFLPLPTPPSPTPPVPQPLPPVSPEHTLRHGDTTPSTANGHDTGQPENDRPAPTSTPRPHSGAP